MPYAGGDRIKETCNNPASSAFVLTGAVVGEGVRAFSSAEDGKYLRYLAKHATAAEAEVGAGLYTHSTRTLTRRHRSYPSEGAGVVTFSVGVVHVASTPSVRDVAPWEAASDPTVNDDVDDGHLAGNEWINTGTDAVFRCVDPAPGAAVWVRIDGGDDGSGGLAFGVVQAAPAPVESTSTITLNANTDTVLLSEEATELRINDPTSARNLRVQNRSGGTVLVAEGDGTPIQADLPDDNDALIGWSGTAWEAKGIVTAGTHGHTSSQISDSTPAGRSLLTAADAAAQRTLLGVPSAFDPVETTSTSITISDSFANQDLISTATGAVTVTLGNATSDNQFGAITEGAQEITVQVASNVEYYLELDDKTIAGRTTSFKVRGSISWQVFRIDSGNRRYLIKGGTNHEQFLRSQVVYGNFSKQITVTGARTVADADTGATLIYTGAGHTWTFNNANLEAGAHGVIRNAGSGTITVTTDGTEKFTGTEPIPINRSATWEWDGTRLWLDING